MFKGSIVIASTNPPYKGNAQFTTVHFKTLYDKKFGG